MIPTVRNVLGSIFALIILGIGLLIMAGIIMGTFNYSIPRLAESVDSNYQRSTYNGIDYATALNFTILVAVIFSSQMFAMGRLAYQLVNPGATLSRGQTIASGALDDVFDLGKIDRTLFPDWTERGSAPRG